MGDSNVSFGVEYEWSLIKCLIQGLIVDFC